MKIFIIILVLIILMGCNDDNVYIPFYQDAIYIMDADGSNKQKVIDVDICTNVQFVPNTSKLLFMTSRYDGSYMKQLHTMNEDGSDSLQISGEFLLKDEQPSISNDGSKIVFWALHDSRDAVYDLYMTDPLGTEIINLTNTEDQSEKDASFIHYQDQEYLLYVTYFTENEINYSTISMMNTTTFEIEMLYIEEIEDEHGFKNPIYDCVNDVLFAIYDYYSVIEYSSLENGNKAFVSYCGSSLMNLSIMNNQLLFYLNGIIKYDYILNQLNELVDGHKFNIYLDKVIYCTFSQSNDGNIYSIKLDGSDKTMLSEDGFYPRFSEDGSRIVYIGRYVTNPRRNLITN